MQTTPIQSMLSQRRSSEQASQSAHSTPSQLRLESALRHVNVLFSTTAFQENDARPDSPIPSQPTPRTSEASAVRRIFSREPRRRPVHSRLAVAANTKNPRLIRIYHLVDYGVNTRPLIHRAWNISDLRRIDGLGQPVSESVSFALHFIPAKVFIFRTLSPNTRASFLWSLLQTCVSRLKRAPPVQHLRLLDLQTLAEAPPVVDDAPSTKHRTSESSRKSVDASGHQSDVPPTRTSEASTKRHSSRTIQSKPTSLDEATNDLSRQQHHLEPTAKLADVDTRQGALGSRARRAHQFPRAFSEPKLSDSTQKRNETKLDDESSQEAPRSEHGVGRDSDVDQLAFEAAAKRFGGNRSSNIISGTGDITSNLDSDPKALWFDNRRRANEANAKALMEQMRPQREKKQATLNDEEKADLLYALDLFAENSDGELHEFEGWLDSHIQKLEVENIEDIVDVESCEPCHETTESGVSGDAMERDDVYDVLIKSITAADPWLRKCESLLEPYARLSQEINDDLTLLEIQQENNRALQVELDALLDTISFTDQQQKLIDKLDSLAAEDGVEVDYSELHEVMHMLALKSNEISKLNKMSEMVAVTDALRLISEKRNLAARSLFPSLKSCLDDTYVERRRAVFAFDDVDLTSACPSKEERVENFRKGLQCIVACENNVFSQVIDHYVELSSSWTTSFLRFAMQAEPPLTFGEDDLDGRMVRFAENFLYGSLVEGHLALNLFNSQLQDKETILPTVLRRQLPSPELLRDFLKRENQEEEEFDAVLHQHFWRSLELFSIGLTDFSEQNLKEIVSRVEQRLRVLYDSHQKRFPTEVLKIGDVKPSNEGTMEAVYSFQSKCRVLCVTSQRLVETHANAVMAILSESLDQRRNAHRSVFFSRVKKAVDLASELSGLSRESSSGVQTRGDENDRSLSICEKIIRTALRRTEVASAAAGEHADDVKLQCYGYISAKLGEANNEESLQRLIRVADRLREHVMGRWVNKMVIGKVFNELHRDISRQDRESYVKLGIWIASLDPSVIGNEIRERVQSTLEEAVRTCMVVPFYTDLISLVKERIDEIMRRNRGNKLFSEVKPTLRAFTLSLISILTNERDSLHEVCP